MPVLQNATFHTAQTCESVSLSNLCAQLQPTSSFQACRLISMDAALRNGLPLQNNNYGVRGSNIQHGEMNKLFSTAIKYRKRKKGGGLGELAPHPGLPPGTYHLPAKRTVFGMGLISICRTSTCNPRHRFFDFDQPHRSFVPPAHLLSPFKQPGSITHVLPYTPVDLIWR